MLNVTFAFFVMYLTKPYKMRHEYPKPINCLIKLFSKMGSDCVVIILFQIFLEILFLYPVFHCFLTLKIPSLRRV